MQEGQNTQITPCVHFRGIEFTTRGTEEHDLGVLVAVVSVFGKAFCTLGIVTVILCHSTLLKLKLASRKSDTISCPMK